MIAKRVYRFITCRLLFPFLPPYRQRSRTSLPTQPPVDIGVFWDFENIRVPDYCPTTAVSESLQTTLRQHGRIVEKKVYFDFSSQDVRRATRSSLDLTGFSLVDSPRRWVGQKETVDKKIIVDSLCFAWERLSRGSKVCVVLISSDGDFSYTLARLKDVGVQTIVIYRPASVANVLLRVADSAYVWDEILAGKATTNHEGTVVYPLDRASRRKVGVSPTPQNGKKKQDPTKGTEEKDRKDTTKDPKSPVLNGDADAEIVLFLTCLLDTSPSNYPSARKGGEAWKMESIFAVLFYSRTPNAGRKWYSDVKKRAVALELVEIGRRNWNHPYKAIYNVDLKVKPSEEWSTTTFMRLTEKGLSKVKERSSSRSSR